MVMKDRISALMDGELDEREAGEVIATLVQDEQARDVWRTYHLIGDALRESPPPIVPVVRPWQWRFALPAMAAAAAVALVSWVAFAPQPQAPRTEVAQAKPPAQVLPPRAANDYLLAHQGFSPRVALQGMAPYVRTVSEEVGESAR